jgi:hypothetical protein
MSQPSITDLNRLINNQVDAHEALTDQLTLLRNVIDFTAHIDPEHLYPNQLNAQFIVIEKLLKEAEAINSRLQAALVQHRSQIVVEPKQNL